MSQGLAGELMGAVRKAVPKGVWGAAVQLARDGSVEGVSRDGDEIRLRVKTRGKALPFEVYLWPDDADWGCDCGRDVACVHVAAATIFANTLQDAELGKADDAKEWKVKLHYAFTSDGPALSVRRMVVYRGGRQEPLNGTLASSKLIVERADAQAESLLALQPGGVLTADLTRRLLRMLDGVSATLDGKPVVLSRKPVLFRLRVTDHGEGFRVGLYRPKAIEQLFRGAAHSRGKLQPTSHGDLLPEQRRMLIQGVEFGADEVGVLVGEYIPNLRTKAPVDIATDRLPGADALVPRVHIVMSERPRGLEVRAELVYGDPPVAKVTSGGGLKRLDAGVIPARDLAAERSAQRQFEARFGRPVGYTHLLSPSEAAQFIQFQLPKHTGPVQGRVDPQRFRILDSVVEPRIEIAGVDDDWKLGVSFGDGAHEADPWAVLDAWGGGRSLVPLLDGGWAPLPTNWLAEHGSLLRELMEARDAEGRVHRNATAALIELLENTEGEVPHDLRKLRAFLEGGEGLSEDPLPEGFDAELRPYQWAGFHWLNFLADMRLNGILADDMGLGKTVQALAAMAHRGGNHLVVCPTSVLRNWQNEANRFAPMLTVNVYHGPTRKLDDSNITLTSYALLRRDIDALRERDWSYVVLDEAQAIKNASSKTARAAFSLPGAHRMALTGTPVENRLEELWSLLRFLMPGLLGSENSFKERFSRPIEAGDRRARANLRARVRPYILRRMKQQVASELPPLTEVVIRCVMTAEQRATYDGVRLMARREVQAVIDERGQGGATMRVLEALLRMRQACCDPTLLPGDVGDGVPSAKLDRMEELLVDVVCDNHKALVFSQWTSLLDRAQTRLDGLGIDYVRLDGSTKNRQDVIDAFQSDDGPPVFLLSLKAGGTGLNLTAADYVLHLDPWWNPAVERQATDRAHRIGQHKPVVSCRLIAQDSVEERILDLQDAKRDLADAALGTDGGFVKSLNAQELRSLFEGA
jgi:superfamily II DNA or RNA helicase